jgi:chromosome segregation ATPase
MLMEEKKGSEGLSEHLEGFLERVKGIGYKGVEQLEDILVIIKHQAKRIRRLKKLEKEVAKHHHANSDLASSLESLEIKDAENSVQLASLTSRISEQHQEIQRLESALRLKDEELHNANSQLASARRELQTVESTMQNRILQIEEEKSQIVSKFSRTKSDFEKRLKSTNDSLSKQIEDLKSAHRQKEDELKKRCKAKSLEIQQDTVDEIRKSFQIELREKDLMISEHEKRIAELRSSLEHAEPRRDDESEEKYQRLLKRIHSLKKELDNITEIHLCEVEKVKRECHQHERKTKKRLQDEFAHEVERIEKELRFEANEQEIENKRLRDQLRQYGYMLEEREAALARYEVEGSRSETSVRVRKKTTGLYLKPEDE